MRSDYRLKYEMGVRALEFSQAHPSDAPRYAELLAELGAAVNDGRRFAQAFSHGRDDAHASAEHRKVQRADILDGIRDIVRVGRAVVREVPELKGYFRVGSTGQSNEVMLSRGRQYAARVAEHQELFAGFGFTSEKLAIFTARIDALADGLNRTHAARSTHIGASVSMEEVADRILASTERLDAINRLRFEDDPDQLAAWQSASSVHWPVRKGKAGEEAA